MANQLSPLEKEFLVKRFLANPNVSVHDFCYINGISETSIRKWINQYKFQGIEGFIIDKKSMPILPEGIEPTEDNYKREIIKLRIENERLKKNYTAITNPDGTTTYIHLKEKSSQ